MLLSIDIIIICNYFTTTLIAKFKERPLTNITIRNIPDELMDKEQQ